MERHDNERDESTVFTAQPRISPFWDDLVAAEAVRPDDGLYVNDTLPGRLVVTWFHQQIFCCTGDDTVQVVVFADGRIQFGYDGVSTVTGDTSSEAITGITPGGSSPSLQVDYVSNPSFTIAGPTSVLEEFTDTNTFNLDGGFVIFAPNATGGYDVETIPPVPARARATHGTKTVPVGKVDGTARDENGIPLVGATIGVRSSRDLGYVGLTRTDSVGHFSITNVPFGGIDIVAQSGARTLARGGVILGIRNPAVKIDLQTQRHTKKGGR